MLQAVNDILKLSSVKYTKMPNFSFSYGITSVLLSHTAFLRFILSSFIDIALYTDKHSFHIHLFNVFPNLIFNFNNDPMLIISMLYFSTSDLPILEMKSITNYSTLKTDFTVHLNDALPVRLVYNI